MHFENYGRKASLQVVTVLMLAVSIIMSAIIPVYADENKITIPKEITIVLTMDSPYMTVDGIQKEIVEGENVKPVNLNGHTLIPIKGIIEAFGGKVDWYEKNKQISCTLDGQRVSVYIGSTWISSHKLNRYEFSPVKNMGVAPQIIDSHIMVPLRPVLENLGCTVEWNERDNTIIIRKPYSLQNLLNAIEGLKKEAELLEETNIERWRLINEAVVEGCDEGLRQPAENSVKWKLLWYKGQALINIGRYDEAIEALEIVSEEVANNKDSSWDMVHYDLARAYMLAGGQWEKASKVLAERGFSSLEKLQNDKLFDLVRETDEYRNLFRVYVKIDGWPQFSVVPQYKNGKLLASLEDTAIPLGAEVEFDEASKKLTISKLGKVVEMQIGSRMAKVNGRKVDMGASPILLDEYYNPEITEVPEFILRGRTLEEYKRDMYILIPLEFLAEFLGQKVTWNDKGDEVNITEDLSRIRYSEDQMIWVNSTYLHVSVYEKGPVVYELIGGVGRRDAATILSAKNVLARSWGIYDRDDFFIMIDWLKTAGHNSVYNIYKNKGDYILTKYKDKLEGKGLIGWDYIRLIRLSGLAYISGYITLEESYDIAIEAAKVIQKTYSSWDEATESYIIGHGFWSGEDPDDTSTVTGEMEKIRKELLMIKSVPWNTLPWNLPLDPK